MIYPALPFWAGCGVCDCGEEVFIFFFFFLLNYTHCTGNDLPYK